MSTRCQVQVKQSGISYEDKITLYHHCDGYPENILLLIKNAYKKYGGSWEAGRSGKVASFLCAEDPGEFEPEAGHELHCDIKYYYIVECVNTTGGSLAEKPTWKIHIYDEIYMADDEVKLGKPVDTIDVSEVDEWLKKRENEEDE